MKSQIAVLIIILSTHFTVHSAPMCLDVLHKSLQEPKASKASFNEVLEVMQQNPYDQNNLPNIRINLWKFVKGRLTLFVKKRSEDILVDKRDYRTQGTNKPIHPMGVGLTGKMHMLQSRWSGVFAGGDFLVVARASISQDNSLKQKPNGSPQQRSTAMAIKVFNTIDPSTSVTTANAVFQNNLNGVVKDKDTAIDYLSSTQSNQPGLDFFKIRKWYEVFTLIGIGIASFKNKLDHTGTTVPINPQIRPVHSLAELGVTDPSQVRTPVWMQIVPRVENKPVENDEFRLEITETLERDKQIIYDLYAADSRNRRGQIQWEHVGQMVFEDFILSKAVDENLIFPHDTFNSSFSSKAFKIPSDTDQHNLVPEDLQ